MSFAQYRSSRKTPARQVKLPGSEEVVFIRLLTPDEGDRAELAMRAVLGGKKIPLDIPTDVTANEMRERDLTVQMLSMSVRKDATLEDPWASPDEIRTLDEVTFRYLDHEYDVLMLEERGAIDIYSATPEQWEEAKKKLMEIPMSALSGRQRRALASFLVALSSSD